MKPIQPFPDIDAAIRQIWPFPDLKPLTWRQRLIRYLTPRKYWWLLR